MEGKYEKSVRHGKGTIEFEDGSVYNGIWDYGTPIRAAVLRTADGRQVIVVTARRSESGSTESSTKSFLRKPERLNNRFLSLSMLMRKVDSFERGVGFGVWGLGFGVWGLGFGLSHV